MKKIVLSFDDSRLDTYEYAYPIIKKYGLTATINVITSYIKEGSYSKKYDSWMGIMSEDNIVECYEAGIEIASHGWCHNNDYDGICRSIQELRNMGIGKDIGFASPHSDITFDDDRYIELIKNGTISYIRSGLQVRREGRLFTFFTAVERYTHSKYLFYMLNKKCLVSECNMKDKTLLAVAITEKTTLSQLLYFVKNMKDNDAVIFMFHSVLPKEKYHMAEGLWKWDLHKFEKFCEYLKDNNNLIVCNTRDLFN